MNIHRNNDFVGTPLPVKKDDLNLRLRSLPSRSIASERERPLAIIRQRARTPGRAGLRSLSRWYIEFEPWAPRRTEPLMGWTSSRDPYSNIRLEFPSLTSAVSFAESKGWSYSIIDRPVTLQRRNYQEELAQQRTLRRPANLLVEGVKLR